MGIYPGSARTVGPATPADIVLVDANGNAVFGFDPSRPATPAITQVTPTTTSATLLAANPARRHAIFYNGSNKAAFLAFGATASTTAYTVQLPVGGEFAIDGSEYAGVVSVITQQAATGSIQVTEVTP